jgi:hypothetical protein
MEPCKLLSNLAKQPVEDNSKTPAKTGGEESEEEEVEQQYCEVVEARSSFWIDDLRDNQVVEFRNNTETTWKAGKIFSERELRTYNIPEASALCVATQVEGPDPGSKAMLRIRKQSVSANIISSYFAICLTL